MKIVFPYPNYWPYVRRGAERMIHELSTYLAGRGHQVEIITSKPGRPWVTYDGDVRVTYHGQISHPVMFHYYPLLRLYHFGLTATAQLFRQQHDVLHMMSYSEIVAAPLLRRWRSLPYLFHLIVREHWWPSRFDRWTFHQLMRRANKVAALTPKWAEHESAAYGVPVTVLPPPVDMNVFKPNGARDLSRPKVLFTADLGDPRKGGTLLLRAWDEIDRRCPEAVLVLAGPFGIAGFHPLATAYSTLGQLHVIRDPAARAAVELRGPGSVGGLPRLYAESAVTVLPSIDEAFGIVVTESLASGTPVVCSSDAGPGEIVSSPDVGATVPLFEQLDLFDSSRARELAEAVLYAIDLARRPGSADRCREWASQWSLERVGRQAEEMYEDMAASPRAARSAA